MRILSSLCCVLALLAHLQSATAQVLTGAPVEISLQTEVLNTAGAGFYVEQVMDARPRPEPLGLVFRGLNSTLREVHLKQGVGPELALLLRSRLPPSAGARPVLLRITSIGITEAAAGAFSTQTAAELAAEWYARLPDSTYYLLCRTYRTTQHIIGTEPLRSHAANLASVLSASLDQLGRVDWGAQQQAGPLYRRTQLRQPTAQAYPVQSAAPLRPGVYASFFEFRQNSPSRPGNVQADARAYRSSEWQGLRAVEPYLLSPEGQRMAVEECWGFCDGKQVYIRFGRDYFLLEQRGSAYMFFAPAARNSNSSLLFNGGPPKTALSLHMLSGIVSDYAGPAGLIALKQDGRPTHLLVYRRRDGSKEPLPVLLNGQSVGQLPTNNYLSVPWQDNGEPVRLCVGPETCLDFTPSFTEPNYLEYQPGTAAPLRQVPVREGAAQVTRMAGR